VVPSKLPRKPSTIKLLMEKVALASFTVGIRVRFAASRAHWILAVSSNPVAFTAISKVLLFSCTKSSSHPTLSAIAVVQYSRRASVLMAFAIAWEICVCMVLSMWVGLKFGLEILLKQFYDGC